jgi:hypothetical protein
MTDYKALCADLHAAFNTYAVCEEHHELLQRTRTAIAQPEPKGPSDEELYDLFDWLKDEWHSNDEREFPLPLFARAVLARWGNL